MAAKFCEEVQLYGGLKAMTSGQTVDFGFTESQRFRVDIVPGLPINKQLRTPEEVIAGAPAGSAKQAYIVYCNGASNGVADEYAKAPAGLYIHDGTDNTAASWKRLPYGDEITKHASTHTSRDGNGYTAGIDGITSDKLIPAADVSMSDNSGTKYKLVNLKDPVNDSDAATKAYVDSARAGLSVKDPVRVATTGTLTFGTYTYNSADGVTPCKLTAASNGAAPVIDGVTLAVGDRLLLKDGATTTTPALTNSSKYNGIYTVLDAGSAGSKFTIGRAKDFDNINISLNPEKEVRTGSYTWVNEGTVNGKSRYVVSTLGTIVIGNGTANNLVTDGSDITWTKDFQAADVTGGNGISVTGNTVTAKLGNGLEFDGQNKISVNPHGDTINVTADGVSVNFCSGMLVDAGVNVGLALAPLYQTVTIKRPIGAITAGSNNITHGLLVANITTEEMTPAIPDEIRFYDKYRNQIWFNITTVNETTLAFNSAAAFTADDGVYAILTKTGTVA